MSSTIITTTCGHQVFGELFPNGNMMAVILTPCCNAAAQAGPKGITCGKCGKTAPSATALGSMNAAQLGDQMDAMSCPCPHACGLDTWWKIEQGLSIDD